MRWEDYRSSDNVEDRRGEADSGGGSGGGLGSIIGGGGGLGIGAIILIFIVSQVTGINFSTLLGGAQVITGAGHQQSRQSSPDRAPSQPHAAPDDQMGRFVAKVLAQTEDTWSRILPEQKGIRYQRPTLVLYGGETTSACGDARAAMGPFYCPNDRKVYLDTAFFGDMKRRLGGGGDFAYAYVIAHEIGHHVQNLMGVLPKTQQLQQAAQTRAQANGISVRVELQADCLAGVWAANTNQVSHIIEAGDVDKAMATAEAIGDDRLQRAARGVAVPDSFTHGSSAQRQKWLNTGLQSGNVDSCNTFTR